MSLSCTPAVFTAERRATLPTQPHSEETMKWPLNRLLCLLQALSLWNDSQRESRRGWAKWPEVLRKPEFSVGHLLQAPLPPLQAIFIWAVRIKNVGEQINIAILSLANIFFSFCLFKIKDYGAVFRQSNSSQLGTRSGFPVLYMKSRQKLDLR